MNAKVLTREELAIHILENIVKNGGWVNDLEFTSFKDVQKSDNDLEDMLTVLKSGCNLEYMVVVPSEEKCVDTYKIGDRFMYHEEEYILAQVDYKECCLISLENGDRWDNPVKINDPCFITQEELNEMCDYQSEKFIKI